MPTAVTRLSSDSDLWSFFMSLADRGHWSQGSGWTWSNASTTVRMGESLVKRGLAVKTESGRAGYGTGYSLSPAALELWTPFHRETERQRSVERKQSQYEHDLRWQDVHARDFAIKSLIEAHQEQFDAWVDQYKAEHPVEVVL
jgi:hypothetical protein